MIFVHQTWETAFGVVTKDKLPLAISTFDAWFCYTVGGQFLVKMQPLWDVFWLVCKKQHWFGLTIVNALKL